MLNTAAIMGRLTADPELRHTQSNLPVTSFTLAVDRRFAKQGEQKVTDFIDVVCWRSTAEFVCRYFKKGQQMALSGSIQTRTWEDKQGQKRKSVEIVANEVFFADSKRDSASSGGGASYQSAAPSPAAPMGYDLPSDDFSPIDNDDELPF